MITRGCYCIWILLLVGLAGTGCSSRAVHEAQAVVAEADSLRAEGKMYEDSAQLAQAYEAFGKWKWFYADEYAHACYHYGRLLREKDNPVEAMQVFISATHSRTHDYHILGRVYSNMGSICHLAQEYTLSYEMYERCAEMLLQDGDSIAYYYALNDMAFELAEQGKKDSCYNILAPLINSQLQNCLLKAYCYSTCSEACIMCFQYDSAIYYSHKALSYQNNLHIPYLQLAQAYSFLSIKDSATFYANETIHNTNELCAINNALYILANDDESKDILSVREISADRSDTQKLIEIRQGKLSQAVQLLEQDLHRKPNLAWLYAVIATLAIIGIFIFAYVKHKWKKHQLLTQKIDALENQNEERIEDMLKLMDERCSLLAASANLKDTICWKNYDEMCRIIDAQFYLLASKLQQKQILNEKEIRLCILVLIGLNRSSIADILPYALNSVGKFKDHTAKLLGTTGKNLRNYLLKLATV